jgi:phospholipid-binding lipoprotein MlaA
MCARSRCATRSELLDASSILDQAALDRYTFQRDAYLQRRRSLIYDGSPPREREVNDTPDSTVK